MGRGLLRKTKSTEKGKLRWGMVAWCFLALLAVYIDRVNLSISAPAIMKEFNLTPGQMGLVMSGFTIGYTILLFPGGFIVSRFSARLIIASILASLSVTTILTGFAQGFFTLLVIRILFGLSEGPLMPAINATVNHWMLKQEKATAASLYITALPLGIIAGNMLGAHFIEAWGWRSIFFIFGVLGAVICVLIWLVLRDTPEGHPWISQQELHLIKSDYEPALNTAPQGSPFGQLIRDPWIWVFAGYNFLYSLAYWANINWLPTYFVTARGTTILKSGYLSSLPWIAGLAGLLVIGPLSDRIGRTRRSVWLAVCQFLSIPFTAYAVVTPSLFVSLACFSVSLFFIMGSMSVGTVLIWDIFDRADVGKVYGLVAAWMTGAGIAAPSISGFILERTGSFTAAYALFAACSVLAGLMALTFCLKESKARKIKQRLAMNLPR